VQLTVTVIKPNKTSAFGLRLEISGALLMLAVLTLCFRFSF